MPSVLQITPYPVFPPRGGRRSFFFLREMAREHDVSLIVPQALKTFQGVRDGYTFPANIEVYSSIDTPPPKTVFHRLPAKYASALQYRWLRRSTAGPASIALLNAFHLIETVLRQKQIDIVLLDTVEVMVSCAPLVRRLAPAATLTLNAHNVDSVLEAQLLKNAEGQPGYPARMKIYLRLARTESSLKQYVDAFWACSEVDRKILEEMNSGTVPGFDVPNGIALELLPFDARPEKRGLKRILFCGSLNYPPNRHGLEWFREHVWPRIREKDPEVRLVIIGYGAGPGDYRELRADPAVDFLGEVDEVAPHYRQTSVAIAPLLHGSGTRVKILEAMSLGNPMISTTIGAEGIVLENGRHAVVADNPGVFADGVLRLLSDAAFYDGMRREGRRLVEEVYDWRVIGRQINQIINQLAEKKRAGAGVRGRC